MARHIAANFVNLLIVLLIAAGGLFYWAKAEFSNPGPLENSIFVEVPRGGSMSRLSRELESEGAIKHGLIMRVAANYNGQAEKLKFGNYEIPAGASMADILNIVTKSTASVYQYRATYQIGIKSARLVLDERKDDGYERLAVFGAGEELPENYAALVKAKTPINYRVTAAEGVTSWQIVEMLNKSDFLGGTVENVPPEGMLAPDTYDVRRGTLVSEVLDQMFNAQKRILAEEWENRAADLPFDTPEAALTLASIIEKETGVAEERQEVSAVFVNRLNKGMKLQMDSTVEYGLTNGTGFLNRGLRRSELAKKTPYNTYIIDGLPPGPIGNPGRPAIRATLNPNTSNNLFFVADGTGGHAFAETLVEHNANVAKWRKIEAENRRKQQQNSGG
ncbi:endolytic transglycosylase MltG [Amylibacter sp. IMCC11727]|uniref:endolytic transglycosylase MltG n=1 Tax=Amylibacter sp. IMCC11727 TaxID=3039851 RepID=UPI00244DB578|nr:endolytic transglycosylase MltG [Amylibacter sp. IMCC11727]WGI20844.1 endolytic transglycosylase MltG [Amylibacter sp. IMCC11727]